MKRKGGKITFAVLSTVLFVLTITSIAASQLDAAFHVYIPFVSRPPDMPPLAACIPNGAQTQSAPASFVVDGDTIHVVVNGQAQSLRYIGIDTPEDTSTVELFGPEATARNTELVNGKTVTIIKDVSETDQYGRLLRYVFVGSTFVNYQLVREGLAEALSYPPDVACFNYFKEAENLAKAEKLGLWSILPTQPPATGPCNCTGPDLDCGNFSTHATAQACFNHCSSLGFGDIFRLDSDGDGLACESLP
jgi:micrococcal nuclease